MMMIVQLDTSFLKRGVNIRTSTCAYTYIALGKEQPHNLFAAHNYNFIVMTYPINPKP